MHVYLKNEGNNAADINYISEKVLLVSRGHYQEIAPDLSCSNSWCEGNSLPWHNESTHQFCIYVELKSL